MTARTNVRGLPLPSPVDPGQTVCVSLIIPDTPEYRQALRGVLADLGKWWAWQHTPTEPAPDATEAAELWRAAALTLTYLEDCEAPVSCIDVTNCITSNSSTRQAVQALVPSTPIDGLTYPPGVPLTPSQMDQRLNEIDDCVYDAFWAQTEQFVDFMIDLGQDVFERLAAYKSALEAGQNVPMGQLLGKLKNGSTAGKVMEFLGWALDTMKAAFESADTLDNRNAMKCALFCAGKDDCLISIQLTLDVLNERLGGLLSPGDLTDLPSLVDAFTTAAINPALALDLWVLFLMGTAKTAGLFGTANIDETIQMVLALAVNDANNDWELLCEDCDDTWSHCVNFDEGEDGGFSAIMGEAGIDGIHDTFVQLGNGYRGVVLTRTFAAPVNITSVSYTFSYTPGTLNATGDSTSYFSVEGTALTNVLVPTVPTSPQEWSGAQTGDEIFLQLLCGAATGVGDPGGTVTLHQACFFGTGDDPF